MNVCEYIGVFSGQQNISSITNLPETIPPFQNQSLISPSGMKETSKTLYVHVPPYRPSSIPFKMLNLYVAKCYVEP